MFITTQPTPCKLPQEKALHRESGRRRRKGGTIYIDASIAVVNVHSSHARAHNLLCIKGPCIHPNGFIRKQCIEAQQSREVLGPQALECQEHSRLILCAPIRSLPWRSKNYFITLLGRPQDKLNTLCPWHLPSKERSLEYLNSFPLSQKPTFLWIFKGPSP